MNERMNEKSENAAEQREETREQTGLVEERLTVEIPTEIQAGLPPCYYTRAN